MSALDYREHKSRLFEGVRKPKSVSFQIMSTTCTGGGDGCHQRGECLRRDIRRTHSKEINNNIHLLGVQINFVKSMGVALSHQQRADSALLLFIWLRLPIFDEREAGKKKSCCPSDDIAVVMASHEIKASQPCFNPKYRLLPAQWDGGRTGTIADFLPLRTTLAAPNFLRASPRFRHRTRTLAWIA